MDTVLDSPLFDGHEELPREISGARWYPSKQGRSTLWAYLDGYVLRGCWEDNSVTVVPVTHDSNNHGASKIEYLDAFVPWQLWNFFIDLQSNSITKTYPSIIS